MSAVSPVSACDFILFTTSSPSQKHIPGIPNIAVNTLSRHNLPLSILFSPSPTAYSPNAVGQGILDANPKMELNSSDETA